MTRGEIAGLKERTTDQGEWTMLKEFLLDKLSRREPETHNHAMLIARLLIEEHGTKGRARCNSP